jgi:hypothetical protein
MNEWLKIMLEEIDRKRQEERAVNEEKESRKKVRPSKSKRDAAKKKSNRNSA